MGKFFTDLELKEIEQGKLFTPARYRHISPLIYWSKNIGWVIVEAGSETDLDSTPRVPFFYRLLGNRGKRAAATHDHLYTPPHRPILQCEKTITRAMADKVLRGATYEDLRINNPETLADSLINICCLGIAWMIWAGCRIGGWAHWK